MFAHPGVTQTTDGSGEEALSSVRIRPPHTHTQHFRACGSGLELYQLPPSSPNSAAGQGQGNARKTPLGPGYDEVVRLPTDSAV